MADSSAAVNAYRGSDGNSPARSGFNCRAGCAGAAAERRSVCKSPLVRPIHTSMVNSDLELFDENPEWLLLLAAYQARHATGGVWISRVTSVEMLPGDQLSVIHGKLIALGLLKFEINNRTDGVQYQVTSLGKQALLPPESRQTVPEWLQTDDESVAA